MDEARRYLYGEMGAAERARFEDLLRRNPHLREELRFLKLMLAGFDRLEETPPGAGRHTKRYSKWWWAIGLLLLGLAAAIGYFLVTKSGDASTPESSTSQQVRDTSYFFRERMPAASGAGGNRPTRYSDRGYSVAWTLSGDILLAGIFAGDAWFGDRLVQGDSTEMDMFVGALSLEGAYSWLRHFGSQGKQDYIRDMAVDETGNVYLTGNFVDTLDFGGGPEIAVGDDNGPGKGDFFVLKLDRFGRYVWADHAGGDRIPHQQTGNNQGQAICVDPEGNVIVGGVYIGHPDYGDGPLPDGGPNEDLFIAKYSSSGRLLWVQSATCSYMIYARDLATDDAGNIYAVGHFGHHNLGGEAYFETDTLVSYGGRDIFLAKYAPDGELLWVRQAGGAKSENGRDYGYGVAVDPAGRPVITGYFEGEARFGDYTLVSRGDRDLFVAKYEPNGDVRWVRQAGGEAQPSSGDVGHDVAVDWQGNIYVAGMVTGLAHFGTETAQCRGWEDAFVAKYGPEGAVQWVKVFGGPYEEKASDAAMNLAVNSRGACVVTGYFHGDLEVDGIRLSGEGREEIFLLVIEPDGTVAEARQGTLQ